MSSSFCNYYYSKWYQKHSICNCLVKENKFGAATFWVRYFFPSLYLFSGTFFRDLLERIGLPVLSLLPFLTFVNCEGPYLAEGSLRIFCPCFDIPFAPWWLITRTSNKIVEIVVTSDSHLIRNPFRKQGIKGPAVPNTPPRETSWRENVSEKGQNLIVTNLQYYQFQQDGCKSRIFFGKKKLNMN